MLTDRCTDLLSVLFERGCQTVFAASTHSNAVVRAEPLRNYPVEPGLREHPAFVFVRVFTVLEFEALRRFVAGYWQRVVFCVVYEGAVPCELLFRGFHLPLYFQLDISCGKQSARVHAIVSSSAYAEYAVIAALAHQYTAGCLWYRTAEPKHRVFKTLEQHKRHVDVRGWQRGLRDPDVDVSTMVFLCTQRVTSSLRVFSCLMELVTVHQPRPWCFVFFARKNDLVVGVVECAERRVVSGDLATGDGVSQSCIPLVHALLSRQLTGPALYVVSGCFLGAVGFDMPHGCTATQLAFVTPDVLVSFHCMIIMMMSSMPSSEVRSHMRSENVLTQLTTKLLSEARVYKKTMDVLFS